jgi:hypothetical protein
MLDWDGALVRTRDITVQGERAEFYSSAGRDEFVRLYRGIYVRSQVWESLDRHERYRYRVFAAARSSRRELLVSHESAAVMWRLPRAGSWPTRVHTLEKPDGPSHRTAMFVRHPVSVREDPVQIDGLSVTALATTAVQLAATTPFAEAVVALDAVLRRIDHPVPGLPESFVTRDDLLGELEHHAERHGTAAARRSIEFADGLADRPGESVSRVNMRLAGIPDPLLQVELAGASGKRYFVDFWWPQFRHIGEFDGRYKYSDPEFLHGRTPEQTLFEEKLREDDLRAVGHGMSRWPWEVALSPARLRALLTGAGVR